MLYPLIGMPQGAEWLVILAIVVLVFGAAKLPDLARGTGQALRIFKAETKGLRDDDDDQADTGSKGKGQAAPPAPTELPPAAQEPTRPETIRSEDGQTDKHNN
jgi:sec-independent protein translocase protein TatA